MDNQGSSPGSGPRDPPQSVAGSPSAMQVTVRQPSVLLGANKKPSQENSLVFSEEYIVDKVLRKRESTVGEPRYEVRLRSGDKVEMTRSVLRKRENGKAALKDFEALAASQPARPRRERKTVPQYTFTSPKAAQSSDDDDDEDVEEEDQPSPASDSDDAGYAESRSLKRLRKSNRSFVLRSDRQRKSRLHRRNYQFDGEADDSASGSNDDSRGSFSDDQYVQRSRDKKSSHRGSKRHRANKEAKGRRGTLRSSSGRKSSAHSTSASRASSFARAGGSGARRSGRAKGTAKSMVELGEDDIWAPDDEDDDDDEGSTTAPRIASVKEVFKPFSRQDPFRLVHSQTCGACNSFGDSSVKGPLVYCQGCVQAFHRACLGPRSSRDHIVTKVADGEFVMQCRSCVGASRKKDITCPNLDMCQMCRELGPSCTAFRARLSARQEEKARQDNNGEDPITNVDPSLINNAGNVLFRCRCCQRAFHFAHLPPRGSQNGDTDMTDAEGADGDDDIADKRYYVYSDDWKCLECATLPGKLQTLVAWRPTDPDRYGPDVTANRVDEDEKEYLVKWEGLSYFHARWMPGAWVWGMAASSTKKAFARKDNGGVFPILTTEEAIPEEYLRVDIVLDVKYKTKASVDNEKDDRARITDVDKAFVKFKGLGYEDAVWENPPDAGDSERWADFVSAYNDLVRARYIQTPSRRTLRERLSEFRSMSFKKKVVQETQPSSITGGELMKYQLDGLNWILYKCHSGKNAILADEMGLGKTLQVIGFISTMVREHACWPFLVVVPNSTCPNWKREIKRWAPHLHAVAYYGLADARRLAMQHELFPDGSQTLKCHVVIVSYEVPLDDTGRRFLKDTPWAGLIVDEGQRLKNDRNLLYQALSPLSLPFKLLLTGTPLQNNVRELFNLLQFLDGNLDARELEEEYAVLDAQTVPKLHELIRPFFLRRTKAQVLTFLPPMAQIIVPVTMTVLQKRLYKSILARNPELVKSVFQQQPRQLKRAERSNLNNILMQLRKCLCHPFVYSRNIEERNASDEMAYRTLIEASSKLQLLEIMLPALKERGHRVLLFSQFLQMLDVIMDFLDGLGLTYERLDGGTTSLQKQKRIDAFNAPDSPIFAFLLSTRAGGVGINLATADTVIIMDPDFNPHQDMQALSRAHRIGQQKKVLVFQLMTRGSAEEKIMQIGRRKMMLDHVLIEKMDAADDAGVDVDSILRHGAAALFSDDENSSEARDIRYDAASVDKLLDRSQAEETKTSDDKNAAGESQFSFARVWANDEGDLQDDLKDAETETPPDPSIWDKLLTEREKDAERQRLAMEQALGRGKRRRQAVDYAAEKMDLLEQELQDQGSDTDFEVLPGDGHDDDNESYEDDEEADFDDGSSQVTSKRRPLTGLAAPAGNDGFTAATLAAASVVAPVTAPAPAAASKPPRVKGRVAATTASATAAAAALPAPAPITPAQQQAPPTQPQVYNIGGNDAHTPAMQPGIGVALTTSVAPAAAAAAAAAPAPVAATAAAATTTAASGDIGNTLPAGPCTLCTRQHPMLATCPFLTAERSKQHLVLRMQRTDDTNIREATIAYLRTETNRLARRSNRPQTSTVSAAASAVPPAGGRHAANGTDANAANRANAATAAGTAPAAFPANDFATAAAAFGAGAGAVAFEEGEDDYDEGDGSDDDGDDDDVMVVEPNNTNYFAVAAAAAAAELDPDSVMVVESHTTTATYPTTARQHHIANTFTNASAYGNANANATLTTSAFDDYMAAAEDPASLAGMPESLVGVPGSPASAWLPYHDEDVDRDTEELYAKHPFYANQPGYTGAGVLIGAGAGAGYPASYPAPYPAPESVSSEMDLDPGVPTSFAASPPPPRPLSPSMAAGQDVVYVSSGANSPQYQQHQLQYYNHQQHQHQHPHLRELQQQQQALQQLNPQQLQALQQLSPQQLQALQQLNPQQLQALQQLNLQQWQQNQHAQHHHHQQQRQQRQHQHQQRQQRRQREDEERHWQQAVGRARYPYPSLDPGPARPSPYHYASAEIQAQEQARAAAAAAGAMAGRPQPPQTHARTRVVTQTQALTQAQAYAVAAARGGGRGGRGGVGGGKDGASHHAPTRARGAAQAGMIAVATVPPKPPPPPPSHPPSHPHTSSAPTTAALVVPHGEGHHPPTQRPQEHVEWKLQAGLLQHIQARYCGGDSPDGNDGNDYNMAAKQQQQQQQQQQQNVPLLAVPPPLVLSSSPHSHDVVPPATGPASTTTTATATTTGTTATSATVGTASTGTSAGTTTSGASASAITAANDSLHHDAPASSRNHATATGPAVQ